MTTIQVRRHTTEVSFDQLHGRALSELERDTITSLSTENLSGESYNGDGIHNGKKFVLRMIMCMHAIPLSPCHSPN